MAEATYDPFAADREAADELAALLKLPVATEQYLAGAEGMFDPWSLFPLYGSYDSDFDVCAITVLGELLSGKKVREDLGAEMFREMLCNLHLCDYGTSPRQCFPTAAFRPLLPVLIEKWKAYSLVLWEEDVLATAEEN